MYKQGIVVIITQIFNVQPKSNLVFKTIDDSGDVYFVR